MDESPQKVQTWTGEVRRPIHEDKRRDLHNGGRTGCERLRPAARRAAFGLNRRRDGARRPGSQR